MYFGLPPAFSIAATMFRDSSTFTAGSLSPWKTQMGIFTSLSACFTSPPPQMGMPAANRSGFFAIRLQVPKPPIDRPVR